MEMKFLESVERELLKLGICLRVKSGQKHPLNSRNVFVLFTFCIGSISTCVHFFHIPKSFKEYAISAYAASAQLITIICYIYPFIAPTIQISGTRCNWYNSIIESSLSIHLDSWSGLYLLWALQKDEWWIWGNLLCYHEIQVVFMFNWKFQFETRKMLLILMPCAQQPMEFECFGSISSNRDTLKKVWSYLKINK